MNKRAPRFLTLHDLLVIIVLLGVVAWAWCGASAKWNLASWTLPTAYLDPVKSDVVFYDALIRAASKGHFLPFKSKIVPELGAPYDANWNDWPWIEEFSICLMGLMAWKIGIFASLNLMLLTGHLLAAAAFYLVARYLRVAKTWAFVSALAFGLAPYAFLQSPHHALLVLYWHIPFFLLVWRWVSEEPGIVPGTRRFWFALAVGFVTGLQMVYYTGIFCQLVLIGGIVASLRTRSISSAISALCIIAATASAFGLMNIDSWLYALKYGSNPDALVREYKWLEIYGLKIVDLFIPPVSHQWDLFRTFSERHAAQAVLQDEGSYLGLFGIAALFLLVGVSVSAVVRRRAQDIPLEAWQILWIILFFSTGGLNAITGLFGFTMFRAACRYSIIILAIVLMFAAQTLTKTGGKNALLSALIAAALSLVIVWDQVPRPPTAQETGTIVRQISSDRKFVSAMESVLPRDAMIFQIPIMDFPEAPAPGVPPYDHFRPYLYSDCLKFSFGSMKGRLREQWQHDLQKLPLPEAVSQIQNRGFKALYINRNGFPDKGKELEKTLRSLGHTEVINSEEGDLACVILASDPLEKPIKLFP